jgi:hypothetical protein
MIWLRIAMGRSMTEDVTAYLSTMRCDVPNTVRTLGPTDLESAPKSSPIPGNTDSRREEGYTHDDNEIVGGFADQTTSDDTLVK